MPVIDEDGGLFGVVNAVDALAVVVAILALAGGIVVLTGGGGADGGTLTQSVTVRTTGAVPAGIAALEPGPVANEQVAAIERVEQVSPAGNGTNATYELDVQLVVGTTGNGAPTFAGERLYIGRSVTLDLENVTVSGVVTAAREPERVESVPTPTPTPAPTTAPPTETRTTAPPTPTQTTAPTQTSTPEPTTTRLVTLEATVDAAVADAITEGPVMDGDVVAVRDRVVVSETDTRATLRLQVELEVVEEEGIVYFRGVALEPGTRLRLPVGGTTLTGTVTDV